MCNIHFLKNLYHDVKVIDHIPGDFDYILFTEEEGEILYTLSN